MFMRSFVLDCWFRWRCSCVFFAYWETTRVLTVRFRSIFVGDSAALDKADGVLRFISRREDFLVLSYC